MIVPVIQARYNSTRFPGKVLEEFGRGGSLLARAVLCARRAFKANPVIAAPEGDPKIDRALATTLRCRFVAGPEQDVLARFACVADVLRLDANDVIVRLTADDPCKIPLLVWLAARVVEHYGSPYADTNHGALTGFGAEAFTVGMLREAAGMDLSAEDREHVTLGMRRRYPPAPIMATVDTLDDLIALDRLMAGAP